MAQIQRRQFLAAAAALLVAPRMVRAQAARKLPVLGTLSSSPTPTPEQLARSSFRTQLRELGWVDGKTILIESAYGEGREDRLSELASTLVAKQVDVILAIGPEAAIAIARATTAIPIVFWGVAFPIEQGLIDSYARPGRNLTGVAWSASPEIDGKRLQVLREIAPTAKRLAFIAVPTAIAKVGSGPSKVQTPAISLGQFAAPAAQKLGYELRVFTVEKPDDFEPVFKAILNWGAQALSVSGTSLTLRERQRIAEFTIRNRLPSAYTLRDFVEAGGLVSYGIDTRPTFAQTAAYVDRILRGAKPAELPVELPSKYELAVNLKTARALGLTVPQSILLRADQVIE